MTWYAPISRTTIVEAPGYGDGIFIARNVTVSVSGDVAVLMENQGHHLVVEGVVMSTTADAAFIGLQTGGQGHSIEVAEAGMIRGFADTALVMWGFGSTIVNDGTIAGYTAIAIASESEDGVTTIINRGLIEGRFSTFSYVGNEDIALTNDGVIRTLLGSATITLDSGDDRIVNRGAISNEINMAAGDDRYDGRKGRAPDTIYGGEGDDRMLGGRFAEIFDGGADNDILRGGRGADTFIFATGDGRDTIQDFHTSGARNDILDIAGMDDILNFKDLMKNHAVAHGKDIWIEGGEGDIVILKGLSLDDLAKGLFVFDV